MRPVRVGCSGWNFASWRGEVYPKGLPTTRWLERYAELFDTVEVNSTFYRLANRDAVARWVEQTPPGFLFSVKASRYLTHVKRLREMREGVVRFLERIEPLADAGRLGPILWQLPPNFQRDDDLLARALAELPPGRNTFEFRHSSWAAKDVYALLREHRVALTVAHHKDRPWQPSEHTADWTFVRFHWGERGRRGNYSEAELDAWARRLGRWRRRVEVLAYFNNDWESFAVKNAVGLARRLGVGPASP